MQPEARLADVGHGAHAAAAQDRGFVPVGSRCDPDLDQARLQAGRKGGASMSDKRRARPAGAAAGRADPSVRPLRYKATPNGDPVQALLGCLTGIKRAGEARWQAFCPFHENPPNGHKPSLSIARGKDGRALVHCQGGCTLSDVLGAIGWREADLFPRRGTLSRPAPINGGKRKARSKGWLKATYDYVDAEGRLLYQVLRYEPKDFRQRRPDGNGGWIWKLNGTPRVLYRLPELLAADENDWVFVCEGEKDADNLVAIGLTATTNPGGARKWSRLDDDSVLHGRRVAIPADKDPRGGEHATDVASRQYGKAAVVKIIDLPDGEVEGRPIKDVTDWLDAHDSKEPVDLAEALIAMAEAAPTWTPPPQTDRGTASEELADSDSEKVSQAESLVRMGAGGLRFLDRCRGQRIENLRLVERHALPGCDGRWLDPPAPLHRQRPVGGLVPESRHSDQYRRRGPARRPRRPTGDRGFGAH